MSYFLILPTLLMGAVALAFLCKRSFAQVAALTNFLYIFFMYFTGLFANLKVGAFLFLGICVALFGTVIYLAITRNELRKLKKIINSPAFVIYTVVGMGLGIVFFERISVLNDELTHWALVVKNMFYFNNFGNIGNTTTMFNQYVPASGLFMFGFQLFNDVFHNGSLYAAFDILALSMVLPVFDFLSDKFTVKNVVLGTIFIGVAVALPAIFKKNMYYNLQVDGLLAVFWSYIFLIYATNKNKKDFFVYFAIGMGSFVTLSTKSSGVALIVFAFVIVLSDLLTANRKGLKLALKKPRLWIGIAFIVFCIVFAKVSWKIYCNYRHTREGWNSDEMTLTNIINWLKNPTEWQAMITENFLKVFFLGKIYYYGNFALQLPALYYGIFLAAMFVILGLIKRNAPFAVAEGIISIGLMVGYGVFLLLLYLFSFSYAESERLASYPRYMLTFGCGILMVVAYMLMEAVTEQREGTLVAEKRVQRRTALITQCVGCAIMVIAITVGGAFSVKDWRARGVNVGKYEYTVWVETVKRLDPEKDSVYYAMLKFNAVEYKRARFYATPMQCSGYTDGGSYLEGRNATEPYTGNPFILGSTTREEFIAEASKYNYLFIDGSDEKFNKQFGDMFEDGIEDKTLYETTVRPDGSLSFKKSAI